MTLWMVLCCLFMTVAGQQTCRGYCAVCTDNSRCMECMSGHHINSLRPLTCVADSPLCLEYESSSGNCLRCNSSTSRRVSSQGTLFCQKIASNSLERIYLILFIAVCVLVVLLLVYILQKTLQISVLSYLCPLSSIKHTKRRSIQYLSHQKKIKLQKTTRSIQESEHSSSFPDSEEEKQEANSNSAARSNNALRKMMSIENLMLKKRRRSSIRIQKLHFNANSAASQLEKNRMCSPPAHVEDKSGLELQSTLPPFNISRLSFLIDQERYRNTWNRKSPRAGIVREAKTPLESTCLTKKTKKGVNSSKMLTTWLQPLG